MTFQLTGFHNDMPQDELKCKNIPAWLVKYVKDKGQNLNKSSDNESGHDENKDDCDDDNKNKENTDKPKIET